MKTNFWGQHNAVTHEGAPSSPVNPLQKLKRLTMACMLWEDQFYVDGQTIAQQIEDVCKQVKPEKIVEVALDSHLRGHLRHVPLLLIIQALKRGAACKEAIYTICSRPDQMTELLNLYWKEGKRPIPAQMKKGLAKAFTRFDAYQLAKYNRDAPIKLRDVLFMCHAKPKDECQAQIWKRFIAGELAAADTWEVRLSSGADKKESFQMLLENGKMGALAIIRNLRNMYEAGVPMDLVARELNQARRPLLPFQFLAAAAACPPWEGLIDKAMISCASGIASLPGNTQVLVDVSGSMSAAVSDNSKTSRMDAACALAILLRETCAFVDIFSFSMELAAIPPRQGMALRDAIVSSQSHQGTYLGQALYTVKAHTLPHCKVDRIIVITDEQTHDIPPRMNIDKCYIINIGSYENGIKNNGQWHTVNGFSEHVIEYIAEFEKGNNE